MPIVPCAQVTIGQPAFGALPFGTWTVPEMAVSWFVVVVPRYRSSRLLFALESLALPVRVRTQIGVPCVPLGIVLGGV